MSNPYLPKWEYIPGGEPRVFGGRIYAPDAVCCNGCFIDPGVLVDDDGRGYSGVPEFEKEGEGKCGSF